MPSVENTTRCSIIEVYFGSMGELVWWEFGKNFVLFVDRDGVNGVLCTERERACPKWLTRLKQCLQRRAHKIGFPNSCTIRGPKINGMGG